MKRRRSWIGFLGVLVLVTACASYTTRLQDLRGTVTRGELDAALEMIDKVSDPGDLLYHLERGALRHHAAQWEESNVELAAAELLLDDLYTVSLSERALTFVLSDEAEAYRGEVYEGHLLHYYRMLNYHHLRAAGETAVEARRLALRLASLRDGLGDDSTLREMPFLQWLIGAILESNGECNDALIAYRWAVRGYQDWAGLGLTTPAWIPLGLLRNAARSGIDPEAIAEAADLPGSMRLTAREQAGASSSELVFLCEVGWATRKLSEHIRIPIFKREADWSGVEGAAALGLVLAGRYDYYLAHGAWSADEYEVAYFLDVAIPLLADRVPPAAGYCEVTVAPLTAPGAETTPLGEPRATLVPVLDVDRLVRHVYRKNMTRMLAKTFARALIKYIAQQQAKKELGALAGILANVAGAATEKADTRAWLLLPAQIHAASMLLPPGAYRVTLASYDHQGGKLGQKVQEVELGERDLEMVDWRVFD